MSRPRRKRGGGGHGPSPTWSPAIAPDVTINELIDPAVLLSEIRDRYCASTTAQPFADALRATGLRGSTRHSTIRSMQASMGIFCTPEQVQQQGDRRDRPGRSDRGAADPVAA